ncbi:MAG: transporter substrate-binding domain-containing protein [Trueperaceae bacterium]|nr:transporter substrate-binding domain-containing protein [Trueperaceae bacterium]
MPKSEIVGSRLFTRGDHQFSNYLATLPEDERWRRFPYNTTEHLLRHVRNDVIAAGLVWRPEFDHYVAENEATDLRAIAMDPLASVQRDIGFVVREDEQYLRTLLDEAIVNVIEAGVMEELVAEHGPPGEPGALE